MPTAFQWGELLSKILKGLADNKWLVMMALGALGSATTNAVQYVTGEEKQLQLDSATHAVKVLGSELGKNYAQVVEKTTNTTIIQSNCEKCDTLEGRVEVLERNFEEWHK